MSKTTTTLRAGTATALIVLCAAVQGAVVDPTRPPDYRPPGTPNENPAGVQWHLRSTLVSPTRSLAIINGQLVGPGESVDGAQVIAIETDRVTLRTGDGQLVLKLISEQPKRIKR